MFLFLQ